MCNIVGQLKSGSLANFEEMKGLSLDPKNARSGQTHIYSLVSTFIDGWPSLWISKLYFTGTMKLPAS